MQILDPSDVLTLQEITKSDDRTTAILATSYLDAKLTRLLKRRIGQDRNTFDKLFKPGKPIGALATKVDIASLLGLFSAQTRDDILVLASMRNNFAHWDKPTTFATKEIRVACEKLTLPQRYFKNRMTGDAEIPPSMARFVVVPKTPFTLDSARTQFLDTINFACIFFSQAATHPFNPPEMI